MTETEKNFGACSEATSLAGYKFRRQHPICSYIADFACVEKLLVVEADGGQHNGSPER